MSSDSTLEGGVLGWLQVFVVEVIPVGGRSRERVLSAIGERISRLGRHLEDQRGRVVHLAPEREWFGTIEPAISGCAPGRQDRSTGEQAGNEGGGNEYEQLCVEILHDSSSKSANDVASTWTSVSVVKTRISMSRMI